MTWIAGLILAIAAIPILMVTLVVVGELVVCVVDVIHERSARG